MSERRRAARPRSTLNDLDVRSWMRFTKSWFLCNPPPRSKSQLHHPAKFPEDLVRDFVHFFTHAGETVLDPFAGVGSAVASAAACGRRGVGIELSPHFHEQCAPRQETSGGREIYLLGDARQAASLCRAHGIDRVHYVITSPPYWNMLSLSRGGVRSVHKDRRLQGLRTEYDAGEGDLGRVTDYDEFLRTLAEILAGLRVLLLPDRYLTVILQNVRTPEGEVRPLAWDLTRLLAESYTFKGERVWVQDNKRLGCWGWPTELVTNVHHHYCLNFKNDRL